MVKAKCIWDGKWKKVHTHYYHEASYRDIVASISSLIWYKCTCHIFFTFVSVAVPFIFFLSHKFLLLIIKCADSG
jgi:hypothetical protein